MAKVMVGYMPKRVPSASHIRFRLFVKVIDNEAGPLI